MSYSWEKEALKKYGKEVTLHLIKSKKQHEEEEKDNDCKQCGKWNEGAISDWGNGRVFLTYWGIWVDGICSVCGKHMDE